MVASQAWCLGRVSGQGPRSGTCPAAPNLPIPVSLMESRGAPTRVKASAAARDAALAERLWEVSEELTKVTYEALRR